MKVTLAYDGSDCSRNALEDLRKAGLPADTDVMIITVSEWFPQPTPIQLEEEAEGMSSEQTEVQDEASARAQAEAACRTAHVQNPNLNISAFGCAGSPAHEIIRKSEEWDADLIIVGSHGRSAMGRLILGSVSQQVISGAETSVRIARDGFNPDSERGENRPFSLLVAIDGSDYSEKVIRSILERSWPEKTEVIVVSSAEISYDRDEETKVMKRLQNLHRDFTGRLDEAGFTSRSIIDTKMLHPRRLILSEAEQNNVDCIFMGARGLTSFKRFMLGSVSTAVAMQAECSVEIVR